MTRTRTVVLAVLLIGVIGVTGAFLIRESTDLLLRPNESGVGPRAMPGSVSIDYPADAAPLGTSIGDWETRWSSGPGGMPPLALDRSEDGVDFWASVAEAPMAIALDVAASDGVVAVAQLAVENAQGSHDDVALVDEIIPAFLAAAGISPEVAVELGVADADSLFGDDPREATVVDGDLVVHLAVNRFGLALGAVGR